jgi:hypothetical protein
MPLLAMPPRCSGWSRVNENCADIISKVVVAVRVGTAKKKGPRECEPLRSGKNLSLDEWSVRGSVAAFAGRGLHARRFFFLRRRRRCLDRGRRRLGWRHRILRAGDRGKWCRSWRRPTDGRRRCRLVCAVTVCGWRQRFQDPRDDDRGYCSEDGCRDLGTDCRRSTLSATSSPSAA